MSGVICDFVISVVYRKALHDVPDIAAGVLGHMVDRTRREFSDGNVAKIAETYHRCREGRDCADVPGFAKSATLVEVRSHGHVLTPGRNVGAEEAEADFTPFAERFSVLQAKLEEQFEASDKLTATIREKLSGVVG